MNLFELLEEEDTLTLEVLNPDGDTFLYRREGKGLYIYEDSLGNLYFARITYQPTFIPYFEFKVGWFEDNDRSKPKYNPSLPENSTAIDNIKRRNTVVKIYRDEILPLFVEKRELSDELKIKPISTSRFIFSKRMVERYTPASFNIEYEGEVIKIKIKDLKKDLHTLLEIEKPETSYKIYCDQDGVLADFDKRFEYYAGISPETYQEMNSKNKFWQLIGSVGKEYWSNMDWMKGGRELWKYISVYNPNILTTPSRDPKCKEGKREWIEDNIFPVPRLIFSSNKAEYATPTSILIDDKAKNLDPWRDAGGIAIECKDGNIEPVITKLKALGL